MSATMTLDKPARAASDRGKAKTLGEISVAQHRTIGAGSAPSHNGLAARAGGDVEHA